MIIKKIMITMTMSCTLVYGYYHESLQEVINARAVQKIYTILSEEYNDDENVKNKLMHATDEVDIAVDSYKNDPRNLNETEDTGPLPLALKEPSRDILLELLSSPSLIFQISKDLRCRNIFNNKDTWNLENNKPTNPLCNVFRNDVLRALKTSHKEMAETHARLYPTKK